MWEQKPQSRSSDIEPFLTYSGCLVYCNMCFKFTRWESKLCCFHVKINLICFSCLSCNSSFFSHNRNVPSFCWSWWPIFHVYFLKSCDIMVSFFFLVTGSPQSAGADDQWPRELCPSRCTDCLSPGSCTTKWKHLP